jgi:quercetin dioxygenase-like cupin family protein
VELHMTELGPGQAPHAPHSHVHEEVLMLRRGTLDATFGGKTARLTAGSVIYMESNMEHGWRNPGTEPAEYFVIALGKGKA